jgi:hypothetical protein
VTAVPLDLNLTPLYRINGQEPASLPGLLALMPPRKAARGREQDRLVLYLLLNGNATFSTAEYVKLAEDAGVVFYQSAGPLTSAMRSAANTINHALLERNMSTSGRGQYAIGWLALMSLRDAQCTLLLSGPMHAFLLGQEARHIFEPGLSGKGLGINQTAPHYFTQTGLAANDRILLTGKVPSAWESTLEAPSASSLESTRRRLLSLTTEDLHSVLMQIAPGAGAVHILKTTVEPHPAHEPAPIPMAPPPALTESLPPLEEAESTPEPDPEPESYPAHMLQPSAYAIPPQEEEPVPASAPQARAHTASDFPASIPRAKPKAESVHAAESILEPEPALVDENVAAEEKAEPRPVRRRRTPSAPREPSQFTRNFAKTLLNGIASWRRGSRRVDESTRKFLPRLLPGNESGETKPLPDFTLGFLAIVIPIVVGTMGLVVYLGSGRSIQYDNYMAQAQTARNQAVSLSDPVMQRDAWNSVLLYVDKAEAYRKTAETGLIRSEANGQLDQLQGVRRLSFQAAFTNRPNIEISRMAATETDLYLLDAEKGEILRAQITSHGLQMDSTFNCKPGPYGGYQVGKLVDILALPLINMAKASVVGVDTTGNLLYCAPNQVPQAKPLPTPSTNWGRVTSITLDGGNLYVLDAPSRAVWVYSGKDSEFIDLPYFFFTEQIPNIQDSIDLAVNGDTLYLLHSDGHLSTCSYSRIESVPTRCQDPATLVNPFPALRDTDLFTLAHITQMMYTSPPDSTILMLGADSQSILRLTPVSLELQTQFRPVPGSLPSGSIGAMTASSNHVLYLAMGGQVYFATDMP